MSRPIRANVTSALAIVGALLASAAALPAQEQVTIRVDASRPIGPLRAIWRFFGGDEPNYATMKDGQKLMADFGALRPKEVYFRTHNLLNTGDGTPALKWGSTDVYNEDAQGTPIYDWRILDKMFDSYLERGVRPYATTGSSCRAPIVRTPACRCGSKSTPCWRHGRPGDASKPAFAPSARTTFLRPA